MLLHNHFPDCRVVQEDDIPNNPKLKDDFTPDWETASEMINIDKIRWAINSFASFNTPGMNGIFPGTLHMAGEVILLPLRDDYRASIDT